MATLLLKSRMTLEVPAINQTLDMLMNALPAPARPAARHTVLGDGKRLRPLLTLLCARLFGANVNDDLRRLAATVEMLHAATLMHDDIVDNAATRRGIPSAHTVFGTTEAILAGDALLSTANNLVAGFGKVKLCALFSRATAETAAGEILELHALHNQELSHREYMSIIRGKTACLIRAACEMGAVYADAPSRDVTMMGDYGEALGLAFQIVDDALDVADPEVTGKPSGGDLREGKLTPPLQMYRDSLSGDARKEFDTRFSQGTFTDAEVAEVCAAVVESGYDAKARTLAQTHLDKARSCLVNMPACDEREILGEILDYVRDRRK